MFARIVDPTRQFPWTRFQSASRPTVSVVLIHPNQRGFCLVQPRGDVTQLSTIFPQGGIHEGESVFDAARREVREEIPSLARTDPRAPFRVLWDKGVYLGEANNARPRSGIPKEVHVVVYPTAWPGLTVDERECWCGFWVFDPQTFSQFLEYTHNANPTKAAIMRSAVGASLEHGLLRG